MKEPKTTSDDEIVARRFGTDHEKPCNDKTIATCALWKCQEANECQKKTAMATCQHAAWQLHMDEKTNRYYQAVCKECGREVSKFL